MSVKHKCLGVLAAAATAMASFSAQAAVEHYMVDPGHTYPSFEADHMGGLSLWRGKFEKSSGTVTLDRAAKTGTVDITIQAASLNFGHAKMNEHARGPDMFNVEKYPTIHYVGKSMRFENGQPVEVEGELTMLGVTKPVNLKINQFMCKMNTFVKKMACGADAEAHFNRGDFGLTYALDKGFKPEVKVLISIEAVQQD